MPFKPYREESRKNWGQDLAEGESITREQVTLGCLLRIADAMEGLRDGVRAILRDREATLDTVERLRNQLRAQRAQTTKARRQADRLERALGEQIQREG